MNLIEPEMEPADANRGRSGMTIVETVIACLILCLGLATSLAAMTMLRGVAHSSGLRLESLHEGRAVLESLTSMPYDAAELSVGTHEIDGWTYTVSMTTGFQTTKDVALKVAWYDAATRKTNQMFLHTSIALCQHP